MIADRGRQRLSDVMLSDGKVSTGGKNVRGGWENINVCRGVRSGRSYAMSATNAHILVTTTPAKLPATRPRRYARGSRRRSKPGRTLDAHE